MAATGRNTLAQRLRSLGTFDSFRVPAYRMLFLGMIGQWASFSMESVARSYLVYDITGSKAKLGLVALAGGIPALALALFGGAFADRMPKKTLIQISQVVMTAVSVGTAVVIQVGYLTPAHPESWWVLVVGGFLMGMVMAMSMPSRMAIIPELVEREQIMNAVSLNTLGMSFFQLIGPAVAGYVIDWFGYAMVYYIMSGIQGGAIVFTSFLPRVVPSRATAKNVVAEVGEGLRYIGSHRLILMVLVFYVGSMLLGMPYQMLMPAFAKDILAVGVSGQGTLMSVSGLGALAASLTLASLPSRRRGLILLLSNVLMGVALLVFAVSVSWTLSLCMMVLVGIGRTSNNTAGAALLQTHVEPAYLGRVMSIMTMNMGLSSLGTFFAGMLAESFSVQWAVGGLAITLVGLSMVGLIPRTVRKLE